MDNFTFTVCASSDIIICVLVSFDVRWSLAFSCIARAIRICRLHFQMGFEGIFFVISAAQMDSQRVPSLNDQG